MRAEAQIDYLEQINHATKYIQEIYQSNIDIGIILGTGLGQLIQNIQVEHEIPYENIPFFPVSTVESHKGKLIIGRLSGKQVIAMQGRFHYYEGYSMKEVTFPVRVLKMLGVNTMIVSNAAGGLDPVYSVGDLMILNDHIDLFPENPLRGKNLDTLGVRFPDMSEPYSHRMIDIATAVAKEEAIHVNVGVYAAVQGPNLETRAEYKYLRTIGADAVGMSTVPEVIVGRHMEMEIFAVSAITDLCSPGNIKKVSIAEVLAAAAIAEPKLSKVIRGLVERL
ncbi:purine-nucleoside phosphorylase [Mongoliitalea lutea]|uniref:Purine nucleoside phosphorylase n=1 Tax=Mongoliitalea lutea TaxID=849756 RepID=A0A8J3G535_9BACT|nr:purine-nucleoside phosphorylase [Mongoliitalea lutea]GHB33478.1 purine nucleoside phosphorylase [Mongoliitalea lutea]